MAWREGGQLRRSSLGGSLPKVAEPLDPVVRDWLEGLGPWTAADRKLLDQLHRYRKFLPALAERWVEALGKLGLSHTSDTCGY